ncbi:hypothetical protein Zmor_025764 [Zophobas morio]|uniref:Uncharacterized protein n=1 Tax=Zophobas morio TaxID=2755281 RepID=A0AA38M4D0_9CUCU|nr:hypothetical protein Zmor_025764 [Zophobas morio]
MHRACSGIPWADFYARFIVNSKPAIKTHEWKQQRTHKTRLTQRQKSFPSLEIRVSARRFSQLSPFRRSPSITSRPAPISACTATQWHIRSSHRPRVVNHREKS